MHKHYYLPNGHYFKILPFIKPKPYRTNQRVAVLLGSKMP